MAPELVLFLVEDDQGTKLQLTKYSDVYAFASVCFEVMTGNIPYPCRTNTHAVTMDKMKGIKPSHGADCDLGYLGPGYEAIAAEFWAVMDQCWDEWNLRPKMSEMVQVLGRLMRLRSGELVTPK